MRVLALTSDWKWTGPAEPLLHAVAGLRARGHEVDAAFPAAPPRHETALGDRARERGIEPVYEPARGSSYLPLRDGGEVRRLRAFLRARGYDVVHAQHARAHLLARQAARGTRARVVASWAHGEPIPERPWNRWLYGPRGCHGLAVLTEPLAARARAWLGGPPTRVGVVPGVVDVERFRPRAPSARVRGELGLAPDVRVVGLVARLQPHRRVELILDAFGRALRDVADLRLLVVGRGTRARQVLTEPVAQLGLGHAVIHAGYRRADYLDVLACMDALVYLVPGSDGSCRAVLETMALGIPTIASRRGALPELVADGETGVLCDEDPETLAAAFTELCRSPERWRGRGKAARQRVLERFTLAHQAAALERLYQSLGRD